MSTRDTKSPATAGEKRCSGQPEARSERKTGSKRLRSKRYPRVERRWAKLEPSVRKPPVLRAMCEVAGVPEAVIADRLRTLELVVNEEAVS